MGVEGGTWECGEGIWGGDMAVWGACGRAMGGTWARGAGGHGPVWGPGRVGPGGVIWATFTLERKARLLSCSRGGRHYSSVQAALQ